MVSHRDGNNTDGITEGALSAFFQGIPSSISLAPPVFPGRGGGLICTESTICSEPGHSRLVERWVLHKSATKNSIRVLGSDIYWSIPAAEDYLSLKHHTPDKANQPWMKELYSKLGHCWGAEDTKYKQELQAHKQELPYMWFLRWSPQLAKCICFVNRNRPANSPLFYSEFIQHAWCIERSVPVSQTLCTFKMQGAT